MKDLHYLEFTVQVERIFRSVIRRCYPTSWHEDHIAYTIADTLARQLGRVDVSGLDRPFRVIWDARKLRGAAETRFGDLAVLVHLRSWSGEEVKGIAFLEAKRRNEKNTTFSALHKNQLKRILKNAPSSRLLLYDYDKITEFEDNMMIGEVWSRYYWDTFDQEYFQFTGCSHAVAVPIGISLATGLRTTELYKYSLPFSVQLCCRYLRGFDLEYGEYALSAVQPFIDRTGGPRCLLLVGVSTGEAEPILPEVSTNLYGPITE